jgi:CRP/FNR family transcriptional regulator, cyclic AMP receptor protein
MIDIGSALSAHPFFAGLDPRLAARVAPLAHLVEHPAGAWIARVGLPADQFLLLTEGRAGIEITAADRDPMIVATVHAGEVVGWSWFVEPHEWHFDVVALDDVRALAIDAAALRAAYAADHELGYQLGNRLTRVVASRLEATRHQLMDIYGRAR